MLPLTLATVLLDPPTTLFAGTILALVSMKLIARDPDREIAKTALYSLVWAVIYGAAVSYMFFVYPDWMLTYLRDASTVPLVPAFVVFVIALAVCGVAGALAAGWLIAQKKVGLAVTLCVGTAITLGLVGWLQAPQYIVVGTFAEYTAGTAPKLMESSRAQFGTNLAGVVAALGAIPIIVLRLVQARRLGSSAAAPSAKPA